MLLVLKDQQDRKAAQVRRDQQALLEPLARKAHKDRRALQAQRVTRAMSVLLEPRVRKATRATLAALVPKASKAFKALLVLRVRKVIEVMSDHRDRLVPQARKVPPDLLASLTTQRLTAARLGHSRSSVGFCP